MSSQKSPITEKGVEAIWEKWTHLEIPVSVQDNCAKAAEPLQEFVFQLFDLGMSRGVLDRSKSYEYGGITGELTSQMGRASFMIGLECASINDRSNAPDLLKIARESTTKFVSRVVALYLEKGIISEVQAKELAVEIGKYLLDFNANCCSIGIKFYNENM